MNCPKCGSVCSSSDIACPECGKSLVTSLRTYNVFPPAGVGPLKIVSVIFLVLGIIGSIVSGARLIGASMILPGLLVLLFGSAFSFVFFFAIYYISILREDVHYLTECVSFLVHYIRK